MVRKIIFWIHLCVGVAAGLVILMMSITGVALTYEHQIRSWSLSKNYAIKPINENSQRLPLEIIFATANSYVAEHDIKRNLQGIVITTDESYPLSVSLGRGNFLFMDPYTAEVLGDHKQGPHDFFDLMWRWHRWFNLSGDATATGRAITGAANLGFLFLIFSGLYLWLPKMMKWGKFRAVLFFNKQSMQTSHARDFNWHHVFGIWSAIPLIPIVATATLFYYSWASDLRDWLAGEPEVNQPIQLQQNVARALPGEQLSLDDLLQRAQQQLPEWNRIQISLPSEPGAPVDFTIDQGNSRQPQKRHNLSLYADSGDVASWVPFADKPRRSRWSSYTRYLHTGEVFGWFGQTIAGIVSFTSIIMVWTGLALAYRRLIKPLFRRKAVHS